MALFSDKKMTFVLIRTLRHHQRTRVHNIETQGSFLIKVTGGGGGVHRAILQLKMLPRVGRRSHFWHPIANMITHFDSSRVVK